MTFIRRCARSLLRPAFSAGPSADRRRSVPPPLRPLLRPSDHRIALETFPFPGSPSSDSLRGKREKTFRISRVLGLGYRKPTARGRSGTWTGLRAGERAVARSVATARSGTTNRTFFQTCHPTLTSFLLFSNSQGNDEEMTLNSSQANGTPKQVRVMV